MTIDYKVLPIDSDLAPCTLEQAAFEVGPAFVYYLHIHPKRVWATAQITKHDYINSNRPLNPQISIVVDEGIEVESEWFLCANGKACGSVGVS
jgi:hypothetical protein